MNINRYTALKIIPDLEHLQYLWKYAQIIIIIIVMNGFSLNFYGTFPSIEMREHK